MILQSASTIKVSTELPVASRHRRDITKKLLKATLNPNKQQQQQQQQHRSIEMLVLKLKKEYTSRFKAFWVNKIS